MYSFDNLSSSLGCISSALALPVSRGRHGKLVDNFSHESDVTSLQDPFTSRPYKTPFFFYYCVPHKIPRGILFQIHVEYSPSSRLLVSALAVYATAFRPMFPKLVDNFSHESDVTSLQDPFTSRPYKTPSRHVPTRPLSISTIVFTVKFQEAFSSKSMSNIRHLLDS